MKNSYRKINLIAIFICFFLILGISVGYSAFSSELNVKSDVTIRAVKDIRITELSSPKLSDGAVENYNGKYTSDTITTNIDLNSLTATASYNITITNNGSSNMLISDIKPDNFNNTYMSYEFSNGNIDSVIISGETLTLRLTYKYKSSVSVLPDNKTLGCVMTFTFEEYLPSDSTYVPGKMLLDLEGTNEPVNNSWVDTINNKTMSLNNVTYDTNTHGYSFADDNAYATLGSPIIPATGDFTLEAFIISPESFVASDDEAIVAQVNDISNDAGRIKFNLYNNNLITFLNTKNYGNPSYQFVNNAATLTKYSMQLVRTNNTLKLYVGGILISSNAYTDDETISQGNFKLGRWNTDKIQQYTGEILAVRVYNRALSVNELYNNYEVDLSKYQGVSNKIKIYDYAINNQVVTSGNGLYYTGVDTYVYKGSSVNNYLKFKNSSDTYRIIGYNADGTMKLWNITLNKNLAFDESGNRNSSTSTYCNSFFSSSYGCNYFNTTSNYNNKTVTKDSTAKTYLDTWYATLNSKIKSKIIEHDFNMGMIGKVKYAADVKASTNVKYNGYVGLLGVIDVLDALNSNYTKTLSSSQTINNNYIIKSITSDAQVWLINGTTVDTYNEWAIAYGTQLGYKRSSRSSQQNNGTTTLFYVQPAFYISSDTYVTGTGTLTD